MPNSSARCAQLPRALDKVPFYTALKKFRDYLRGDLKELNESEIVFSSVKLSNCVTEYKENDENLPAMNGEQCENIMDLDDQSQNASNSESKYFQREGFSTVVDKQESKYFSRDGPIQESGDTKMFYSREALTTNDADVKYFHEDSNSVGPYESKYFPRQSQEYKYESSSLDKNLPISEPIQIKNNSSDTRYESPQSSSLNDVNEAKYVPPLYAGPYETKYVPPS